MKDDHDELEEGIHTILISLEAHALGQSLNCLFVPKGYLVRTVVPPDLHPSQQWIIWKVEIKKAPCNPTT